MKIRLTESELYDIICEVVEGATDKDGEYLEAVKSGDMEKAERMVRDAASAAMSVTKITGKVYHGTNKVFTVFERKTGLRWTIGIPIEVEAQGFFFCEDIDFAGSFARSKVNNGGGKVNIMEVYLDIKNPADLSELTNESENLFHDIGDYWPAITMGYETIDKWWQMVEDADVDIPQRLRKLGYDGIIFAEEIDGNGNATVKSYFAIDPRQIKSADPVTYDNNGDVIPLSQRFDMSKDDIRY